jgi:hypothetical protein
MSTIWYECKVKYIKKQMRNGGQKVATEPYLVSWHGVYTGQKVELQKMSAYRKRGLKSHE